MSTGRIFVFVLILSACPVAQAAIIIDFESLRHDDNQVELHGAKYYEDGFVIEILDPPNDFDALVTLGTSHEHFSGSTSLMNRYGGEFMSIMTVDGRPFDLVSINLDDNGLGGPPGFLAPVAFTGFLAGGGTVENTFLIDNINGQQSFIFSGFDNVTDVQVGQFSPGTHQVDNIVAEPNVIPEPIEIDIDIRDSINLKSKGVLPVGVASTDDFDVADIDVGSLLFGDPILIDAGATPVSPIRSALEDITGDGLLDLALKFGIPEMVEAGVLGPLSTEAVLTGSTFDGMSILGSDTVRIVPANIPEPTTSLLAAFSIVGLLGVRRRG